MKSYTHRSAVRSLVVMVLCMGVVVGTTGCGAGMTVFPRLSSSLWGTAAQMPEGLIPAGTEIVVQTTRSLQSNVAEPNEPGISFSVSRDIVSTDGRVLIARGAPVVTVVQTRPHRRMGRRGHITMQFLATQAVDGTVVPLRSQLDLHAGSRAPGMVLGFMFVGPIILLRSGNDLMMLPGTTLPVRTAEMVQVGATASR